jgi:hypothetical protein
MPTEPPPGVIAVPLTKECLVLLTEREYVAGIRRGKWWRRRAAMERRGQAAPPRRTEHVCPEELTESGPYAACLFAR